MNENSPCIRSAFVSSTTYPGKQHFEVRSQSSRGSRQIEAAYPSGQYDVAEQQLHRAIALQGRERVGPLAAVETQ
jgi:hypothetical protein